MNRYEDVSDCEVDHSFFDSDFEEDVKKDETAAKIDEKENGEHTQMEHTSACNPDLKMETKVVMGDCTGEERKEKTESQKEYALDNEVDHPDNSLSSLPALNSESASTSCRNSAQTDEMYGKKPTQVPQIVKEHEENYYTDGEDSSDDSRSQKVKLKFSKQSNSGKVNKNITASSSSSSPSCSSDTDCSDTDSEGSLSDSSCSSSKKKSICTLALLSPRQKSGPKIKSIETGKPKLGDYAEESEDTVTDVTPLSTPDISPIQSFELAASNDKKLKIKRQENVSQELYDPDLDHKCHQKVLQDAVDLNQLLKAFLQLEKKEQQKLVLNHPSTGTRKNYSFTNDEVRQIDQENQRLLKELTKYSVRPRSKSATLKKPSGPSKVYHSAINRQKEQQRIDRENLAFLKRLEAVKPTMGMKRSEQLMDYQRQMSYLSSSPTPRRGKSALSQHSPSSGGSRASSHSASSHSASSTVSRRSERPVFDTSSGALQRLNPTNIPAAWL